MTAPRIKLCHWCRRNSVQFRDEDICSWCRDAQYRAEYPNDSENADDEFDLEAEAVACLDGDEAALQVLRDGGNRR